MTRNIFLLGLSVGLLAISGLQMPIAANAQSSLQRTDMIAVVTTKKGLNLRGRNCEVLKTIPFETTLQVVIPEGGNNTYQPINTADSFTGQPIKKTCRANGKNYQMQLVSIMPSFPLEVSGYVATQFLTFPYGKTQAQFNALATKSTFFVSGALNGLNIRDENCRRIGAVANNHTFVVPDGVGRGGEILVCKVRGEYYDMGMVYFQGDWRFAANSYISRK